MTGLHWKDGLAVAGLPNTVVLMVDAGLPDDVPLVAGLPDTDAVSVDWGVPVGSAVPTGVEVATGVDVALLLLLALPVALPVGLLDNLLQGSAATKLEGTFSCPCALLPKQTIPPFALMVQVCEYPHSTLRRATEGDCREEGTLVCPAEFHPQHQVPPPLVTTQL